jgi:hypothetical protein
MFSIVVYPSQSPLTPLAPLIKGGMQGETFILGKNQFLSLVPPLPRGVRGVVQDLSLPLSHLKGVR